MTIETVPESAPAEQSAQRRAALVWLGNHAVSPWPSLRPVAAVFERREDGAWVLVHDLSFEPLDDDPGAFSEAVVGFAGESTAYRCELSPPIDGIARGDTIGFNAGDLEVYP